MVVVDAEREQVVEVDRLTRVVGETLVALEYEVSWLWFGARGKRMGSVRWLDSVLGGCRRSRPSY